MFVMTFPAFSQVGIGTTNPDASSVLDVSSSSKGLLVPRLSTVQRLAIGSPAEGLLVFDNTTATYWYFQNGQWYELLKNPIGGGVNNTYFESDGTLVFNGNATVYNDFVVPLGTAKAGGNSPGWEKFRDNGSGSNGVWVWTFANSSTDELQIIVQMPHEWKEGSAINPHIHWSPMTSASGAVKWGMEYTWANYDQGATQTYPATTMLNATSASFSNAQYGSMITSFGPITLTNGKISNILLIRLFRNSSDPADTYPDKVAGLSFDIHYEANTLGSRTEFTK